MTAAQKYSQLNEDGLVVLVKVNTVVSGMYYFTNYGFSVVSNGITYLPLGMKAKFLDSPDSGEPKASIEIDNISTAFINILTRSNFGVGTLWEFGQCSVLTPDTTMFIQPMRLKQASLNNTTLTCEFDIGFSLATPALQVVYDSVNKPNLYK